MNQRSTRTTVLQLPLKCHQQNELLDRENALMMRRLAKAMKGGSYPSPSDSKLVDDQLNKAHLNRRRQKLEAEAVQVKQIQQQNAHLLRMLAKIDKDGGRVTSRWDQLFVADWNRRKELSKTREEAQRRQLRSSSSAARDERRRLRRVESAYSHERLHDSWMRNVQMMYNQASAPESNWWTQYMHKATGTAVCAGHPDCAVDRCSHEMQRPPTKFDVVTHPMVRQLLRLRLPDAMLPVIDQRNSTVTVRG